MKIGLIGAPGSGKTTIFNALTRSNVDAGSYNGKAEPHLAVVPVMDERIGQLTDMYHPRKVTYATIELVDFAGLAEGAAKNGLFSGNTMGMLKNMDALVHVVRNFDNLMGEEPNPLGDLDDIDTELLLSDMIITEKRLERIELLRKRGQGSNELDAEERVLQKICEQLNGNGAVRDMALTREERKMIRGFQYLTGKPLMIILNSEESRFRRQDRLLEVIGTRYRVIECAGLFEMELSRFDSEEEALLFMEDMGIEESMRDRLTTCAYELVGYISFFTVGEDEVRAWTIVRGDTAMEAAGTIHTDLARGFIRAECFTYEDLMQCRAEKGVKENGKFRLEGKDYIVRDGDILSIRFSV